MMLCLGGNGAPARARAPFTAGRRSGRAQVLSPARRHLPARAPRILALTGRHHSPIQLSSLNNVDAAGNNSTYELFHRPALFGNNYKTIRIHNINFTMLFVSFQPSYCKLTNCFNHKCIQLDSALNFVFQYAIGNFLLQLCVFARRYSVL